MALFDISYKSLVNILLPPRLRNSKMMAWLNALTTPVVYIYNLFTVNRNNDLYNLAHTSQVCFMQGVLNDTFDYALRRIYIIDGPEFDPLYIYTALEEKPLFIYKASENDPQWLYTTAETALGSYDFIVIVPHAVTFDEARMSALIDEYRLASKGNYKIQII